MAVIKWAVLCGIILCFVQNCADCKTIHLKTGYYLNEDARITGETIKYKDFTVNQYLGIQYAHSNNNRFNKASQIYQTELPKKFQAVKLPPACPQYTKSHFPWYYNSTDNSEDCLYMNIWVPEGNRITKSNKKKAIMIWIHGGEHRYGSARDDLYNGTILSAVGDIVVITLNYRLGFFAYFTDNSASARGNNALKDILEALKFVNQYIEHFGGDKTRITLAGQGSGATDVAMLSFTKEAEGLFHRQILQSPFAFFTQNTTEQNLAYSQQLAKLKECANDSYTIYKNSEDVATCMKRKPTADIMYGEYELGPKSSPYLYPQWGDDTFKTNPRDALKNGEFPCNQLLIGANQDEGSYLLTAYEYQDIFGFYGEKNAHLNRTLGEHIIRTAASSQGLSDPDSVVSYYLPDDLKDDVDYEIRTQVFTALGNILYHCPTQYIAEKWQDKCKNAYIYYFNYRPRSSPWADWMGVTHFDEVKYVFGKPIPEATRVKRIEAYVSAFMVEKWAEFVKKGRPDDWYSDVKPINPKDLQFHQNLKRPPYEENCNFLKPKFGL